MTKREYCTRHDTIAYYSGLSGLEIKGIEYTPDGEYIYAVSGAWGGGKAYHRCKIYYPANGRDSAFFRVRGYKIPLDDCIHADL